MSRAPTRSSNWRWPVSAVDGRGGAVGSGHACRSACSRAWRQGICKLRAWPTATASQAARAALPWPCALPSAGCPRANTCALPRLRPSTPARQAGQVLELAVYLSVKQGDEAAFERNYAQVRAGAARHAAACSHCAPCPATCRTSCPGCMPEGNRQRCRMLPPLWSRSLATSCCTTTSTPPPWFPPPLQLRVYYSDARALLPPSDQEASLTALNLLRLLVQARRAPLGRLQCRAACIGMLALPDADRCYRPVRHGASYACRRCMPPASQRHRHPTCAGSPAHTTAAACRCRTALPSSTLSWRWCPSRCWRRQRWRRCAAGPGRRLRRGWQ